MAHKSLDERLNEVLLPLRRMGGFNDILASAIKAAIHEHHAHLTETPEPDTLVEQGDEAAGAEAA